MGGQCLKRIDVVGVGSQGRRHPQGLCAFGHRAVDLAGDALGRIGRVVKSPADEGNQCAARAHVGSVEKLLRGKLQRGSA